MVQHSWVQSPVPKKKKDPYGKGINQSLGSSSPLGYECPDTHKGATLSDADQHRNEGSTAKRVRPAL